MQDEKRGKGLSMGRRRDMCAVELSEAGTNITIVMPAIGDRKGLPIAKNQPKASRECSDTPGLQWTQ